MKNGAKKKIKKTNNWLKEKINQNSRIRNKISYRNNKIKNNSNITLTMIITIMIMIITIEKEVN